MQKEWIAHYHRIFNQLKNEVESYENEETMFKVLEGTTNSAGNLVIHLIGNIQHFYGGVLLDNGYVRNREHEFNGRMSREQMLLGIEEIQGLIEMYFSKVSSDGFDEPFPEQFAGREITLGFAHLQFLHHFTYHLGQINYHRRALSV